MTVVRPFPSLSFSLMWRKKWGQEVMVQVMSEDPAGFGGWDARSLLIATPAPLPIFFSVFRRGFAVWFFITYFTITLLLFN